MSYLRDVNLSIVDDGYIKYSDTACTWISESSISEMLDNIDIKEIEKYLRKRKLKNIMK